VAIPGAIYRAVADRPVKGQGGIFVKLPDGSGFLRQISGVAPGQRLLVQVTGPAEPGKAHAGHDAASVQVALRDRHARCSRPEHLAPDQGRGPRAELVGAGRSRDGGGRCAAGPDPALGLPGGRGRAIAEDIAAMRGLAEAVLADVSGGPELLVDGPSAHDLAFRDWLDPRWTMPTPKPGSFDRHGVTEALDALLRAPRGAGRRRPHDDRADPRAGRGRCEHRPRHLARRQR
jgi:ribonuclease G